MKTLQEFGSPGFILVDFRNLTDSSFYVYERLSVTYKDDKGDSQVFHTGAIFGFLRRVLDLKQACAPQARVLIAQECSGPSFRRCFDSGYKGKRKAPPEILRNQFLPLSNICRKLGWSILSVPGHEADDVLATWATQLNAQGQRSLLMSNDKDLLTHITSSFGALRKGPSGKYNMVMTPEDVLDKHGIVPALMSDYLAIVGDAGDEYCGVPGVGPSQAPGLLGKYGSIEAIYSHLEELPKGLRGKLEKGRAELDKSLKLARLVCDLPEAIALLNSPAPPPQLESAKTALLKLQMQSIIDRLDAPVAIPTLRGSIALTILPAPPPVVQPDLFR